MEERAWYIIQTYAGLEDAAKRNIERRIVSMDMEEYFFGMLIPETVTTEKKKNGEVKEVHTKTFPGYIFIDMIVTDETWFMVRNTPMVTGFLGSSGGGSKPVPLLEEEINPILKSCGMLEEKPFECNVGDDVEIIGEAFYGNIGKIKAIDNDKRLVTVEVDFLGRTMDAEIDFSDVRKVEK